MPIYMDRHDVSETVTAENVADLHQADLKIQHEYNCRGLTYWFDEQRNTAFCLIEAPDEESLHEMHKHAHGEVPHKIIEVDASIVESFLGRIEDPKKAQNTQLNIINDPAFRVIMVSELSLDRIQKEKVGQFKEIIQEYSLLLNKTIEKFGGRIVKIVGGKALVSFKSVINAIESSTKLKEELAKINQRFSPGKVNLKIALNAGVPVDKKDSLFEDTILLAERMILVAGEKLIVSSDVKDLYKSENLNADLESEKIQALSYKEQEFLCSFMNFTKDNWRKTELKVNDYCKGIGYSKSQFYRKMMALSNNSLNNFLKEYRLNKALLLLNKGDRNISEVSYETGFVSPSYFSKCFQKRYGILPSEYKIV